MTDTSYLCQDILGIDTLCGICDAGSITVATLARRSVGRGGFLLHQWPVTLLLVVAHCEEGNDDCNPVEVVREDRTVGRRILPSENCVENSPSSATIHLGIAALFVWSAIMIYRQPHNRDLEY